MNCNRLLRTCVEIETKYRTNDSKSRTSGSGSGGPRLGATGENTEPAKGMRSNCIAEFKCHVDTHRQNPPKIKILAVGYQGDLPANKCACDGIVGMNTGAASAWHQDKYRCAAFGAYRQLDCLVMLMIRLIRLVLF